MSEAQKPRLVGINHVAIEVGDIDEALAWYGRIFDFTLRRRRERNAFIDMGDQFLNMRLVPDHESSANQALRGQCWAIPADVSRIHREATCRRDAASKSGHLTLRKSGTAEIHPSEPFRSRAAEDSFGSRVAVRDNAHASALPR
jgi:catechol 2,3-dioxygenase-like lactoylglutathione lyase family enzyme